MREKYRIIMTIILAVITFTAVIVLTNDAFDDLPSKNIILISLVFLQICIGLYNLYIKPKK